MRRPRDRTLATLGIALAAGCSSDLFHSTDWSSRCTDDPSACGTSGADAGALGGAAGAGGAGGAPQCESGKTLCDAKCVDTKNDGAHCGRCDHACPAGQACGASACTSVCPAGTAKCGTSCVDPTSDPQNCDGCAKACSPGGSCQASHCVPPPSCKALATVDRAAKSGPYLLDGDGTGSGAEVTAYCDMQTAGGGWTLVLKLSGGDFCWGSVNWSGLSPINGVETLDATLPAPGAPDAKSSAFFLVNDVTELMFETSLGTVTTTFAVPSSPMTLMTTNTVPFAAYPDRAAWRAAFGHDRNEAPIFMRAGAPVTDGNVCRTNPAETPHGCGQPCMFCYQASDGDCCGCAATMNDTSSGIGNDPVFCGGGQANCSTAGTWSNPNVVTLVWAR